ncbi:MAG: DNA-deoxyinosine glycosylase [Candidatus Omnitrophota bacterium]
MTAAVHTSFPPVGNRQARILILGSMPGPASLAKREYYAHPHNAFWAILEKHYRTRFRDYQAKKRFLAKKRLALWDVLCSCERRGAADAKIRKARPNDIAGFLRAHPGIQSVLFNGASAERYFLRWFKAQKVQCVRMPSTSPAYASLSFRKKYSIWVRALQGKINP